MARLITNGFEYGSPKSNPEGEGMVTAGGPTIVDAATAPTRVRSGDFAARINSTNIGGHEWGSGSGLGVEDQTYFARAAFNIAAFGAGYTSTALLSFQIGPSPFTTVSAVRLTPAGNIQLTYNAGAGVVFIGSAVAVSLDTYYVIELETRISAAGNDTVGWRLNGVLQHEDTALTVGTTMGDVLNVGAFDTVGSVSTAVDIYYDDVALNDDTGGSENSWPDIGKIVMLRPTSDNARVGWTDNAGATTNLYDALDNTPPSGEGAVTSPGNRGAGTAVFTANNVQNPTALTPTKNVSTVDGDVMFLVTESRSITATVSTPTGWTLVSGFPKTSGTASGGRIYLFTRTANSGADDAPTVTWTGLTTGTSGDSAGARILSFTGVSETVDAAATVTDTAATSPATLPSITTATNNALVLGIGVKQSDTVQTATVATFTERSDDHTASGTGHLTVTATLVVATAGASGTAAITPSSTTSSRWLLVTTAFQAAASSAKSQIKDANNNATDTYDANMESYTTAGIPSGSTIKLVQGLTSGGNSTATARTMGMAVQSNPTVAEATASTSGVAAAWTSNWLPFRGTVAYAPSVTLGTSPVIRLRKGTASTDIMMFSALGLYVDFLAPVTISKTITQATTVATAQTLSVTKAIRKTLGPGTTVATATALTKFKTVTRTVIPVNANAAQPLSITKTIRKTLGLATTVTTAQALDIDKKKTLGVASTANTAQTVVVHISGTSVAPVTQPNTAQTLTVTKTIRKTLGIAAVQMTATSISVPRHAVITPATLAIAALSVDKDKHVTVVVGTNLNSSRPASITKRIFKTLGVATTTATARSMSTRRVISVVQVSMQARPLSYEKNYTRIPVLTK